MIPRFPEFKKLELSDRADVEKLTQDFLPYSDFNFTSMWSWDTKGEMRISELSGNLVVKFTDYITSEPFYSFIGINNVSDTAALLIEVGKVLGQEAELKLIPEETAKLLSSDEFVVTEDRNNFDYIHSIKDWSVYAGGDFARKRNEVNTLLASHPTIAAREIDLTDSLIEKSILDLFDVWIDGKVAEGKAYEENEKIAFARLLKTDLSLLHCVGLFLEDRLVGFCIYEMGANGYVMGHSSKTDKNIHGSNAYLVQEMARIIEAQGGLFFNYQQDLGVSGLRTAKERFRPVSFLKKYVVRVK